MKRLIVILVFQFAACSLMAQENKIEIFREKVKNAANDTVRIDLLSDYMPFWLSYPDTGFVFADEGLKLAQSMNYKLGAIKCHLALSIYSWSLGDFETAINLAEKVLIYGKSIKDTDLIFGAYATMVNCYRDFKDYREALRINSEFTSTISTQEVQSYFYGAAADIYYRMGKYDSVQVCFNQLESIYPDKNLPDWINLIKGQTLEKLNKDSLALLCYRKSITGFGNYNLKDLIRAYNGMAELFLKNATTDSASFYANKALHLAQKQNFNRELSEAFLILSKVYEKTNTTEAFKYLKLANKATDNLFNQEKQQRLFSLRFNEEIRQQEARASELEYKNKNQRLWIFSITGALLSALLVAFILFRNNRNKQKAKQKIESAFNQLKSTQSQLIQSEKMASLGELTAGIAHEIQNPLNFVNNFSEVNKELIDELDEEANKGNLDEVKAIAKDIKENEQKINHHGKRADAIVKGMLQHSRTSTGQKELTDINALADEYLRLAYHGLRAKDKSFNADFKTELDKSIPKINVIPQDIGRVLLNLINNAFYAVDRS